LRPQTRRENVKLITLNENSLTRIAMAKAAFNKKRNFLPANWTEIRGRN
jgi:hypothetical protein